MSFCTNRSPSRQTIFPISVRSLTTPCITKPAQSNITWCMDCCRINETAGQSETINHHRKIVLKLQTCFHMIWSSYVVSLAFNGSTWLQPFAKLVYVLATNTSQKLFFEPTLLWWCCQRSTFKWSRKWLILLCSHTNYRLLSCCTQFVLFFCMLCAVIINFSQHFKHSTEMYKEMQRNYQCPGC